MSEFQLVMEAWTRGAVLLGVFTCACAAIVLFARRRSVLVRWGSLALLLLAAAFAAAAASDPRIRRSERVAELTVLVDVSESMEEGMAARLLERARELAGDSSRLMVLPFAGHSALLGESTNVSYRELRARSDTLDRGQTDLAEALRSARGRSSSLLLITDGRETTGSAREVVAQLGGGTALYPLVADERERSQPAFRISQLRVPLVAPAQKSVDIRVSLLNSSSNPRSGTLEIFHDSTRVLTKRVTVGAGEEILVTGSSDPAAEGIKEIRAVLHPEGDEFAESSATAYLAGEEREKILILSGASEDARFLVPALTSERYRVESIVGTVAPTTITALSQYSAVILNNIALNQLPGGTDQEIERYVRGGGGFLMIGGNRSFGLGGYLRTAIERILPVEILPPQTTKKRLNIAVELVMDKSRSMSFDNKLEYAKEAAREVVRTLKDDDFVGVIGFDAAPFNVFPLERLATGRSRALSRIGQLFATGKTYLLPALDEARRALTQAEAGRKHIIVLTDGQLPDEGPVYTAQVRELRMMGLTVSTILLGSDVDVSFLRTLAELGGGAFYQTADARNLPRIFLQDVKVVGGEETMHEEREYLVREGPGGVRSTKVGSFPPLLGYVQTKRREDADLELVAVGADRAEPLLASWKIGKGRSLAFTSDSNGRWSAYWARWGRYQSFWSDLIDAVRPSTGTSESRVRFDLRYQVVRGDLELELAVFDEVASGAAKAVVIGPDGKRSSIEFLPEARGRYRATVSGVMAGTYRVESTVGGRALTPVAFALSGELFGERRGQGVDIALLSHLAGESRGKVNPSRQDLVGSYREEIQEWALDGWCAGLALLLFALAVMVREIPRRSWRVVGGKS